MAAKKNDAGKITLAHGAGGSVMGELIREHFVAEFSGRKGSGTGNNRGRRAPLSPIKSIRNPSSPLSPTKSTRNPAIRRQNGVFPQARVQIGLASMDDSAVVDGIVFTTDSHTVKPIFFPGGDIGSLSVAGTVNDLSVMGAVPLAISSAFVIEEGFPISDLRKIIASMGREARRAGVQIVTGDTKVVERGAVEKIIVNTSGIGLASPFLAKNHIAAGSRKSPHTPWLSDSCVRDGDVIILSGTIGDHGIAVLSSREGYGFEAKIKSDVAPLNGMIALALRAGGIVAAKDPTRGGLANALNEWSEKSGVGIEIGEDQIPVNPAVRSACGMLGLDPLQIGNEGKAVFAVAPKRAKVVLAALRKTPDGRRAAIIGRASKRINGVVMNTAVGGRRIVEQPAGDPVPRIC